MAACAFCGQHLRPGATFCAACGEVAPGAPAAPHASSPGGRAARVPCPRAAWTLLSLPGIFFALLVLRAAVAPIGLGVGAAVVPLAMLVATGLLAWGLFRGAEPVRRVALVAALAWMAFMLWVLWQNVPFLVDPSYVGMRDVLLVDALIGASQLLVAGAALAFLVKRR